MASSRKEMALPTGIELTEILQKQPMPCHQLMHTSGEGQAFWASASGCGMKLAKEKAKTHRAEQGPAPWEPVSLEREKIGVFLNLSQQVFFKKWHRGNRCFFADKGTPVNKFLGTTQSHPPFQLWVNKRLPAKVVRLVPPPPQGRYLTI